MYFSKNILVQLCWLLLLTIPFVHCHFVGNGAVAMKSEAVRAESVLVSVDPGGTTADRVPKVSYHVLQAIP